MYKNIHDDILNCQPSLNLNENKYISYKFNLIFKKLNKRSWYQVNILMPVGVKWYSMDFYFWKGLLDQKSTVKAHTYNKKWTAVPFKCLNDEDIHNFEVYYWIKEPNTDVLQNSDWTTMMWLYCIFLCLFFFFFEIRINSLWYLWFWDPSFICSSSGPWWIHSLS